MSELREVIQSFTARLAALIESQSVAKARAAVLTALGVGGGSAPKQRGGRPKVLAVAGAAPSKQTSAKARKKPPRQLCPVPGCNNTAAPIFGMVCAQHKGLPKSQIKKYRDVRKAKKLGLPPARAAKATKRGATKRATKRVTNRAAMPIAKPVAKRPITKMAKPATVTKPPTKKTRSKPQIVPKLAVTTSDPASRPADDASAFVAPATA